MSEFKTGQGIYIMHRTEDPIRTTIKRATKTRATVSIDGEDVVFHLRGAKGREQGRGRHYKLIGYQAEDHEIDGDRWIRDAYEANRKAKRSGLLADLQALQDRARDWARGATLDELRALRAELEGLP